MKRALILVAAVSLAAASHGQLLRSERVAQIPLPVYVTHPPGDFSRIFVVTQTGTVRIIRIPQNLLLETPFLSHPVTSGGEQGLLGMAFHPNFFANGFVYIAFNEHGTDFEAIGRYTVSAGNPHIVDPFSFRTIMRFQHPSTTHNGGWLGFGPDGMLYMSSGDGAGSPQDLNGLGGKILRIDVNGDDFPEDSLANYRIPPDNPLIGEGRGEIWAWGLRNPWRCAFDSFTGDFFIADVGATEWEEINFQPRGLAGQNYGWRCYEGNEPRFSETGCTDPALLRFPFLVYGHQAQVPPTNATGCSVSGGEVYRGCAIDGLAGTYFFADFCSTRIFSCRYDGTTLADFTQRTTELDPPGGLAIISVAGFGRDAFGEIYICDLDDGEVFKILPVAAPIDCNANGRADRCDIAMGASRDVNLDHVPDECEASLPGDINGDGDVGLADLALLLAAFGACEGDPRFLAAADVVANNCVDLQDLAALLAAFGS